MADSMRMKNENPKLKQSEIANQLRHSSSSLQRYRNDINLLSPKTIQPNDNKKRTKKASNTNSDKKPHREIDVQRPRLTSKQLQKDLLLKLYLLKVKTK